MIRALFPSLLIYVSVVIGNSQAGAIQPASIQVLTSATMSNGVPFNVEILILDQTATPISDYAGSVNLSISRGTITPTNVSNFIAGKKSVQVISSAAVYDTFLTAAEDGSSVSGSAPVPVDSDGDGLTDEYELSHFGSTDIANPSDDSDVDGLSNLQEFIALTDPTNTISASVYLAPIFQLVGTNFVLTFKNTSPTRLYTLEYTQIIGAAGWVPLASAERGTDGDLVFTDSDIDQPRLYRGDVKLPP